MKIIQNLVSTDKYNIKCPYFMNAEFIVVHNTTNDAPARNEVAYMIRNDNKVSFHYAVDDVEIVQGILDNRNAWHAGDGDNGQGNRNGLSIEICYSKSGGDRFIKAEKLASKFIASKLKEKSWGIDKVKKHQDFSGKYCPHKTLDLGWQRFLNMVQFELNKLSEVVKVDNNIKISLHGREIEVEGIYKDNTNYIPVRALEKLGYVVGWDKVNKVVTVEYKGAK